MVFAVSDATKRDLRGREARAKRRRAPAAASPRRAAGSISIHWPRVIALGLNIAAWVAIIALARRFLHP